MRIAYLHHYFTTPAEPGGTRSYEFAVRLSSRGHTVEVITTDYRADPRAIGQWAISDEGGVRVHRLNLPYSNSMGYGERIVVFLRFALQATRQLFRVKPDIIFATSTPLSIAIPALIYRLVRRVPMVFEVRDAWPEIPIALGAIKNPILKSAARLLEILAYFNSYAVVALSPGMKDSVARTGYPSERITVIPNACDFTDPKSNRIAGQAWLSENPWARGRTLVVYLGAMGITHDVKYIVELASKVKSLDPKVCFVIFGEGAEHDAIVSRASQLQILGESVYVLPQIPKADIGGVLSVATAGISTVMPIPELEANSANKFFDYLAAGKPVVINYGGWQQALLEDTGAGIRLDYADLDKAAADLVAFLSDPNALNKRSDAANELARSRFSRDDLANQLIQIFEKQALDMATSSAGIGE